MPDTASPPMIGRLATGILVLALLYFASSVFVPLAFALFVMALVWPIQATLQQRVPKLLALLVTLTLTVLVIVTVGSIIVWGFSKLGQWLFLNAGRFQTIYINWNDWLEGHDIAIVGPIMDRFDVAWLVGFVQGIAGRLNSVTGFAILAFILVMLGLLEIDDFDSRLRLPAAQPQGERILRANREIGEKLRRFMVVRTLASVLTGLVVWGFALLAGLELAAAWGAIAFALNYIPFLGPLIATVFPTLFAIAQFEVLADGGFRLHHPQHHPVHYRQLSRAASDRSVFGDFTRRGHFRGVLLELHVGVPRCVHRGANPDRLHRLLRAGTVEPMARRAFVQRRRRQGQRSGAAARPVKACLRIKACSCRFARPSQ